MYIKHFDRWNNNKKEINEAKHKALFTPGDIYWCEVGVNVGSEIDGKGERFTRPVLVVGVFKQNLLFVIPLTSSYKKGNEYFHLLVEDKEASLCFHQAKTISKNRCGMRIERISKLKLQTIKNKFSEFYSL
jgi:mRNA interferase MazF